MIFLTTLFPVLAQEFLNKDKNREMDFSPTEIREELYHEDEKEMKKKEWEKIHAENGYEEMKSFQILAWAAANFGGCVLTEAKFRMEQRDRRQFVSDFLASSGLAFILMVLDKHEGVLKKWRQKERKK